MRVIAKSGMEYVPEWDGNKSLPKGQQVTVKWKYITGPERDRLYGIGAIPIVFDGKGNMPDKFEFKLNREGAVLACTVSVENLTIEENGKERKAEARDLCELPELAELYDELADFYMEQNRSPDKKKPRRPSSS